MPCRHEEHGKLTDEWGTPIKSNYHINPNSTMPCYQDPHQGYTPSEDVQKLRNQLEELRRNSLFKDEDFEHADLVQRLTELQETKQKLANSELENNLVSAYLCAILNELEVTGNLIPTLLAAEKNGQCEGIRGWWSAHKSQDVQRLKSELNKHFSTHEIELLKKIINENPK